MGQITKLFASLTLRQKISIAVALIIAGVAIYSVMNWRKEQDFKPLYSNLAPEDAAAVTQKLREGGVEYRLSENGATVSTPSAKTAESRLLLAGAGLPKTGRLGFELFDKTTLGVTDFTEHINYRRAVEGELERSILAISGVENARVHITFPKDSVFVDSRQPAKASVLVRMKGTDKMTPASVASITHLVSSAVEGLAPEAVSVMDTRGSLLTRARRGTGAPGEDAAEATDIQLEYRQRVERDLLAKINQTLGPVLGEGKFRAGVSVECDNATLEESEETYDQTKSAILTSEKTQDELATAAAAGVPGTSSNLPRPTSRPRSGNGGSSRVTENTTYQPSRMVRHMKQPRGGIKKLSVAVLVDHAVRWEGAGENAKRVVTPPSADTLKVIRDMVAGVAGIDTERGDQLSVDTLPFENTTNQEPALPAQPAAEAGKTKMPAWVSQFVANPWAALVGLAVVVVFFLMRQRTKKARVEMARQLEEAELARKQLEEAAAAAEEHVAIDTAAEVQKILAPPPEVEPIALRGEALTNAAVEFVVNDPKAASLVLRTWLAQEQA